MSDPVEYEEYLVLNRVVGTTTHNSRIHSSLADAVADAVAAADEGEGSIIAKVITRTSIRTQVVWTPAIAGAGWQK